MLHNEARGLLVQGYEATHDAKGITKAYSVSKWMVYQLAEQKRKTGSVALRTSQQGRKPVLTAEDRENIQHCIAEIPDITIEEKRNLSASCSTVERAIDAMGYTLKKKSLSSPNRPPFAGLRFGFGCGPKSCIFFVNTRHSDIIRT